MFRRASKTHILLALIPMVLSCSAKDPIVGPTTTGGGGVVKGWNWVAPLPQGNNLNAVASINTNTAVAVGDAGTIVRTTNGGASWTVVLSPTTVVLRDVSFGSSTAGMAVGDNGVILRTTDGGVNWAVVPSGTAERFYGVACVSATKAIVVGLAATILTTDNLGDSWIPRSSNGINSLYDVSFFDELRGAIATPGSILWTSDGGVNWTTRAVSGSPTLRGISVVGTGTAFAIGDDFDPTTRFYKTTNAGVSWVASAESFFFASSIDIDFSDPSNGIGIVSGAVIRTTDGGSSWTQLSLSAISPLAVSTSGNAVSVVGSAGFLMGSSDGGANFTVQSNPVASSLNKVEFFNGQTGVAVGDGIFRTTNGGASWVEVDDKFFFDVSFGNTANGAAVGSGGIYRSSDGGVTWTQSISNYTTAVHMGTVNAGLSTSCTNGRSARRTTDGGANWTLVTEPAAQCYYGPFVLNANTILVGGQGGRIYRTTNGGSSWTTLASGVTTSLTSINFNLSRSVGIAVGLSGTIVRTTDQGLSWVVQASGVTTSLRDIAFSNESTVYVVGSGGTILRSTDVGISWQQQDAPTVATLNGVSFATDAIGVIVGSGGIILRTTSGGEQ